MQKDKCRLCEDKNETINQIMCECSKLAQGIRLSGKSDPLGIVQETEI